MAPFTAVCLAAVLLATPLAPALAQDPQPGPTWSQEDTLRIVKEVQKRLGSLTNYGVFDDIHFAIQGKTLILKGYASRPTLKDDAGRAVKGIEGIQSVDNQIEVLPLSPNDDRIRQAVYARVYGSPAMRKYFGGFAGGQRNSIARQAGGITADPPMGYHAIHIIVKNGNVILRGVVLNASDAAIAGMQANSAPGAFSVENELVYKGAPSKKATPK